MRVILHRTVGMLVPQNDEEQDTLLNRCHEWVTAWIKRPPDSRGFIARVAVVDIGNIRHCTDVLSRIPGVTIVMGWTRREAKPDA